MLKISQTHVFIVFILLGLWFFQTQIDNFYPHIGGYFTGGASEKYGYGGLARFPQHDKKLARTLLAISESRWRLSLFLVIISVNFNSARITLFCHQFFPILMTLLNYF